MRGSRSPSGSMARFSIPQCSGSAGGASRQPPHKPKSRSGFCPLRLFLYTIRTHPAGCRRNRRSGVSLLHRCLFVCYTFQFVYLCIYYPFCISFIGYLPLFGNQTDLFSQKNPAFLPYKRPPPAALPPACPHICAAARHSPIRLLPVSPCFSSAFCIILFKIYEL